MHSTSEIIESYLQSCVKQRLISGSVYLVGFQDRILAFGAIGSAVLRPQKRFMKKESIFDLASLTKPLCTANLAVLLSNERSFSLKDPVHRFLPEFKKSDKRKIRLDHLLTHTSGLPAWVPLYLHATNRKKRLTYLAELELKFLPGKAVLYGCPAYILMAEVIREVTGKRIDILYKQLVMEPLELKGTFFNPPPSKKERIVATEKGNIYEKNLAGKSGKLYRGWRKEMIWGSVHDHNAFTMGGVAGNAGLFSTAKDLFSLSRELLGVGKGLLSRQNKALLLRNRTSHLNEDRTLGWQKASSKGSSAGSYLPPSSIGHTGFTGVSLWIDPHNERTYILLANRLHPKYRAFNMNAIRRKFHRLAARL